MQELEDNNKLQKNIDLFMKIGDTIGILHAKIGTIKDRKVKDLTEANEIRRCTKIAQKNCMRTVIMTGIGMMFGSLI